MTFAQFWEQFKTNFKSAWPMLMSMWFIFSITLMVYPSVFYLSGFNFMSSMDGTDRIAWYNVLFQFMFNTFDTVGRKLGG